MKLFPDHKRFCARKQRLQTAQNKLIRFILQLSARSHVGYSEFKMAGMLPVEKRVTQLQLNHIFNIVHGNAPNYLKSNFIFNEHSFNTRSSTLSFIVPNVTTNYGKSTFASTGIKARCLQHFITSLKKCFLKNRLRNIYLLKFYQMN